MKKIMLDLETLGLATNAAILTIGAVSFDEDQVTSKFYSQVSLTSSVAAGLTVDPDTIKFWMSQPEDARKQAFAGSTPLFVALQDLSVWLKAQGEISEVWSNGILDTIWLKSAWEASKPQNAPAFDTHFFPYYKERDFRTAKALLPRVEIPDEPIAHHAMHDAKWQAEYLIKTLKEANP